MSSRRPSLSSLQAAMMDALQGSLAAPELLSAIRAPAGLTASEAVDIYGRSMQSTLIAALRLSFPTIERVIGRDGFLAAASSFVRVTPSRHGDLDRYGATFGDFLADFPPASELSYLADLARLEWLIHSLHRKPEQRALTRAELADLGSDAIADRPIRLVARCALFSSPWAVARIWQAHRDSADAPDFGAIDAKPDCALILASEPTRVMLLDRAAWVFLQSLVEEATMLVAVDHARAIDTRFDLQAVFASVLDCGGFASLTT